MTSLTPVRPAVATSAMPAFSDKFSNTELLGHVLYTKYFFFFQAAGIILLVAMIGAIVLTMRERAGVKRQNIPDQVARTPDMAVEVRKVPFRQGV